jgi:hypothetical protein
MAPLRVSSKQLKLFHCIIDHCVFTYSHTRINEICHSVCKYYKAKEVEVMFVVKDW